MQAVEQHARSMPRRSSIIPPALQDQLALRIHYPIYARKKGWQGRVTLQLQIRHQRITACNLIASSGYRILDLAAMRGLQRAQALPLNDGSYIMPIRFRLP